MSTTPEPFRYIDADQFCLSARLLPGLDAGALSISVEGDGEPQSVHVPVADMPKILAGLAAAAGVQLGTRPEEAVVVTAHSTGNLSPAAAEALAALAAVAKRQILQDGTPARPVPDTERRERYAAALYEQANPGFLWVDAL
ncbi:hypothetical protein, partial [Streptomyces niveus]|uniref:hypothetical protein n=1 Tax=Streptomyces niveus TaxID=193462 RepID=UPI00341F3AB1